MESSVHSFATTLERTVESINKLEAEIEEFLESGSDNGTGYDPLAEAEADYAKDNGDESEGDEELMRGIQAGKNQFLSL